MKPIAGADGQQRYTKPGDSGAPVYQYLDPGFANAVGLMSFAHFESHRLLRGLGVQTADCFHVVEDAESTLGLRLKLEAR
jgi:hypothetical protein